MAWGYGRHACPGRFFATQEVKVLLAQLLLEYDFKMPNGLTERYADLDFGMSVMPDPSKEIMFKRLYAEPSA